LTLPGISGIAFGGFRPFVVYGLDFAQGKERFLDIVGGWAARAHDLVRIGSDDFNDASIGMKALSAVDLAHLLPLGNYRDQAIGVCLSRFDSFLEGRSRGLAIEDKRVDLLKRGRELCRAGIEFFLRQNNRQ
jgi:hypothetical protein